MISSQWSVSSYFTACSSLKNNYAESFRTRAKKRYFRLLYYHNSDDKRVYCSANYDHQLAINGRSFLSSRVSVYKWNGRLRFRNVFLLFSVQLYTHTPKLKSNNNYSVYNTYIHIHLKPFAFSFGCHLIFGFCGQNLDKPCLFSLTTLVCEQRSTITYHTSEYWENIQACALGEA